ncbi:DUF371 domain-containing protein [Thermococcus henrietii]|uniref:DUF371 domain-containing protein n=1 Tax=Thermococcus henrietii TaxID=2016361 RepID=UPI000C082412|nr:DUF371 domain-containing protein [Thermococcus henrietii]
MLREVIHCRGHENVRATHRSTLEITTEDFLTPRGDCIICVSADKALSDLSEEFKDALRRGARLRVVIRAGNLSDELTAYGSPNLKLESPVSMVIRRSDYIDARTLAIKATKSAKDIKRELVELLRNPETIVTVELIIEEKA